MKTSIPRSTRVSHKKDWISAIGTLLFLSGIYSSMDNFASYAEPPTKVPITEKKSLSVAPPYWNEKLSYGFRSIAGDSYIELPTGSGRSVSVMENTSKNPTDGVKVSYFPNTSVEILDKSLPTDTPRVYAHLSRGIAVIEGDINSLRAKTIFSTLHSD